MFSLEKCSSSFAFGKARTYIWYVYFSVWLTALRRDVLFDSFLVSLGGDFSWLAWSSNTMSSLAVGVVVVVSVVCAVPSVVDVMSVVATAIKLFVRFV
jgi:hypothetical protein